MVLVIWETMVRARKKNKRYLLRKPKKSVEPEVGQSGHSSGDLVDQGKSDKKVKSTHLENLKKVLANNLLMSLQKKRAAKQKNKYQLPQQYLLLIRIMIC